MVAIFDRTIMGESGALVRFNVLTVKWFAVFLKTVAVNNQAVFMSFKSFQIDI